MTVSISKQWFQKILLDHYRFFLFLPLHLPSLRIFLYIMAYPFPVNKKRDEHISPIFRLDNQTPLLQLIIIALLSIFTEYNPLPIL